MSGQTRIINRLADAQLVSGDYVLVDSQTEGTRKFDLGTFANTTNTAISNIESAINNTSEAIGDTDISEVGDGTFTGGLADHEERLDDISEVIGNTSMGTTATTVTGAIAEHEGDITTLNSKTAFVLAMKAGVATSISASGATYSDIDITKSGYQPLSLIGFDTQNTSCVLISIRLLNTTTIRVWIKNLATTAQSATPTVTVLYQKS